MYETRPQHGSTDIVKDDASLKQFCLTVFSFFFNERKDASI